MLRWSDDTRTLELSVRDLGGRGGAGAVALSPGARARAGQAVHRPEAEVSWRHVELVDDWHCVVHARVDGLVDDLDGYTVIEEIKSVGLPEGGLAELVPPPGWTRQVQCYLHVAHAARLPTPRAHFRLVSLVDGSQRVLPVPLDPAFAPWLRRWLAARVRHRELWLASCRDRRRKVIPFPFPESRPGQGQLLDATVNAVHTGAVAALEAPTGLGKTAPVLVGALRAAFASDLGLFWATARNTQRWIVERTAASLDLPLRSVTLPARAELCPACAAGTCEASAELADLGPLANLGQVSAQALRDEGARQGACPWALGAEFAAQLADLVVADLNYAFDPDVFLRSCFAPGAARAWTVVVDEAHQLPDRARSWASARLDTALLDAVDATLADPDDAPFRGVTRSLRAALERGTPDWAGCLEEADSLAVAHLQRLARRGAAAAPTPAAPHDDPWFTLCRAIQRFATYAERDGEEVVVLRDADGVSLLCRDPSFLLRERFEACRAVVATSATLEPAWFWRARCGVDEGRFSSLRLPSGFPPENRLVLVARSVSTAFRDRPSERERIVALVDACADAVPGNIACFFGSFDQMEDLLGSLSLAGRDRLVQTRGLDATGRAALAAALVDRRKALCAVLGGALGESIDLPPGALDAAIVVGPALPPPSPELALLTDWYERRFTDGFGLASIHPGLTRVVQASGRVVRGPAERGAVVLVCRRFQQHAYAAYFPPEWRPEPTSHPAEALRRFFGG